MDAERPQTPRIVIVGAGFGGLACAKALGGARAEVVVIDRRNHNLFQPLLYQVATAALSPADIAEPIRRSLARYRNVRVVLGEVAGIDTHARTVLLSDGSSLAYDELVIATGSQYNYFGHDDWRDHAPGLKTIHEARLIRHRLLTAFERAEREPDPVERRRILHFVVIGGGPTGVEMAGAISELGRYMVSHDFRNIEPEDMAVTLVEAGPRILAAFPEKLAAYAHQYLQRIGVRVLTQVRVEAVGEDKVTLAGDTLHASCIIWGAGVKAATAAKWLGVDTAPDGRIPVEGDLSVKGVEAVHAIGDVAAAIGQDGKPLPALAQVAKQQGTYLGRRMRLRLEGYAETKPFQFRNRGNTAVVGRNAAIFDFGRWTLKGRAARLLWAIVHVYLLINMEKRVLVLVQWIWRYVTRQRGARLIDEDYRHRISPDSPRSPADR